MFENVSPDLVWPSMRMEIVITIAEARTLCTTVDDDFGRWRIFRNGRFRKLRVRTLILVVESEGTKLAVQMWVPQIGCGIVYSRPEAKPFVERAWAFVRTLTVDDLRRRLRKVPGTCSKLIIDSETSKLPIWDRLHLDPSWIVVPEDQRLQFEHWLKGRRIVASTQAIAENTPSIYE